MRRYSVACNKRKSTTELTLAYYSDGISRLGISWIQFVLAIL